MYKEFHEQPLYNLLKSLKLKEIGEGEDQVELDCSSEELEKTC